VIAARRLVVCAFAFAGTACSVVDPAQRRTVDWCDAQLAPSSPAVQYALLPVAMPIGWLAYTTDAVLVNPVLAVDDAWSDTVELLWTANDESGLRRALFVPLAALATPVVFGGDWLARCLFPIGERRPARREEVR
jgi:hypothetical protein